MVMIDWMGATGDHFIAIRCCLGVCAATMQFCFCPDGQLHRVCRWAERGTCSMGDGLVSHEAILKLQIKHGHTLLLHDSPVRDDPECELGGTRQHETSVITLGVAVSK